MFHVITRDSRGSVCHLLFFIIIMMIIIIINDARLKCNIYFNKKEPSGIVHLIMGKTMALITSQPHHDKVGLRAYAPSEDIDELTHLLNDIITIALCSLCSLGSINTSHKTQKF